MADWREERLARITADDSPTPVAVEDGPDGGYAYHPTRLLVSDLALQRGGALLTPGEFRNLGHELGWLPDLHLHAFELTTGENLPARLRELNAALPPLLQQGDDPAAAFFSVDHVLFGAPKYHGDPGGAPALGDPWLTFPPITEVGPATVAVLDTGIASTVAAGIRATTVRDNDDDDLLVPANAVNQVLGSEAGHGTFIVGLVQRMSGGMVRVDVGRVLSPDGVGYDSTISKELSELAQAPTPVGVVNMSLGGYTSDDRIPPALSAALGLLPSTTVVVAAAGNGRPDCPPSARRIWPGAAARVVAVGSIVDEPRGLRRSVFSNFGPWVDVWTLGENLLSTFVTGEFVVDPATTITFDGWATWSGTSFATALVTAEIARRMKDGLTGEDAWESLKLAMSRAADDLAEQDEGVHNFRFDPMDEGIGLDPRER